MKYPIKVNEVQFIELLDDKSLKKLNSLFNTHYKNQPISRTVIKENLTFKRLKKLMEEKPKGGGYAK